VLLTAFVHTEVSGALGPAPVLIGSYRIMLCEPFSLRSDLFLGIRDLAGEAGQLAGQLPVTPPVKSDLPMQLALPQLQVSAHPSVPCHTHPNTRSPFDHNGACCLPSRSCAADRFKHLEGG
jgi:hypothetical protein